MRFARTLTRLSWTLWRRTQTHCSGTSDARAALTTPMIRASLEKIGRSRPTSFDVVINAHEAFIVGLL